MLATATKLGKKLLGIPTTENGTRGPGLLGWRGPDMGTAGVAFTAPEFRASTNQICGMWPFAAGSSVPMVGTPLGRHQFTGAPVCCDPVSWFRAGLIRNPSMFILGEPGLGKTSVIHRICTALYGFGTIPIVLGDIRPDYIGMIRAFGGQVITIGDGEHYLNILDPGDLPDAIRLLEDAARAANVAGDVQKAADLLQAAEGRLASYQAQRLSLVVMVVELSRRERLQTVERNIIAAALSYLDETVTGRVPVLADLLEVVQNPPQSVRTVSVDRGSDDRYRNKTEQLEEDLIALTQGVGLGAAFSKPTSEPMRRDRPVVFDLSAINEDDKALLAAAMLACWSVGMMTTKLNSVLADHGLAPRRHYFIVLDELHRALQAGSGVIDHLVLLTRLNRSRDSGQVMATHTMADLEAVPDEHDRERARELVAHSQIKVFGGLPPVEVKERLTRITEITGREAELIGSWSDPGVLDERTGEAIPPGRGKFLIKVGRRPGIPVDVVLTSVEADFNRINDRWKVASRLGDTTPGTDLQEDPDDDWE